MKTTVELYLKGISLGEPANIGGFITVPLFSSQDSILDYLTMHGAVSTGSLKVTEVTDSGRVGDLLMSNSGARMVLALDGEELEGAKQNRILNTTVLLAGKGDTVIPVSCTEQGRWAYVSSEFKSSVAFATPRIRQITRRSVTEALKEKRGFRANQGEVWEGVMRLSRDTGVHSSTSAMSDIFKSRLLELNRQIDEVPIQPGQCGLLITIDGKVLGLDMVSRIDAYAQFHRRLLRSYLLEVGNVGTSPQRECLQEAIEAFFKAAISADESEFKSVGLGDDYRYEGRNIIGSALVHCGEVVHAAFFSNSVEGPFDHTPEMRSLRTRIGYRRHLQRSDPYR